MRPTRRGWFVLLVVIGAMGLSMAFSPRALNAVAAPLLVAIVIGIVQVGRTATPDVSIEGGRPGFPGETRTRAITLEGRGLARVQAPVVEELVGESLDGLWTLPATVEQHYTLAGRGEIEHAPLTVRQRDSLGLVARQVTVDPSDTQVVYPELYDLGGPRAIPELFADRHTTERQAFDSLREYVPGDPLRDVHWKTSAKYDDYLVMEFSTEEAEEVVSVVADADPGRADAMASAAATVALLALDAGRVVEVTVPDGSVGHGQGHTQRTAILELLARTSAGEVPPPVHDRAEVSIHAAPEETTVAVGDRRVTMAQLREGRRAPVEVMA